MSQTDLQIRLDAYLALREALGFSMHIKRPLQDFVRYLEQHADGKPIRAQLALDWACRASGGPAGSSTRLTLARGFLRHLKASWPETEIPDRHLIATPGRSQPYLFDASGLTNLLEAAGRLRPRRALRPHTLQTLFGLLACTGLRAREAINLLISDVQLDEEPTRLLIRHTKFKKSRWVPLHPSAADQLRHYKQRRHELKYDSLSDVFFVSEQGRAFNCDTLLQVFQRLVGRLGIRPRPGQRRPTLGSFRHTFAVQRLRQWYEAGLDVNALLPNLSIYLGHIDPASSYWYLTATPELLGAAAQRFETYAGRGGAQ